MKAIIKIIFIVLISAIFLPNSISNSAPGSKEAPSNKDIWLTAPLDNEQWTLHCYEIGTDTKPIFRPITKEKPDCPKWTIVQKLDIWSDTSATGLVNKYIWKLFTVIVKLWILLAIWVIVFGWIVVSASGSDDAIESWKWKIIGWIAAFLIIVLAWVILHTINPLYFVW